MYVRIITSTFEEAELKTEDTVLLFEPDKPSL